MDVGGKVLSHLLLYRDISTTSFAEFFNPKSNPKSSHMPQVAMCRVGHPSGLDL